MKLIAIQDNVMINPKKIQCVKTDLFEGKLVIIVQLDGGASFPLHRNFEEFIKELEDADKDKTRQFTSV